MVQLSQFVIKNLVATSKIKIIFESLLTHEKQDHGESRGSGVNIKEMKRRGHQ